MGVQLSLSFCTKYFAEYVLSFWNVGKDLAEMDQLEMVWFLRHLLT